MKQNALSLQSSAAGRANLRTYIHAAKAAGFDCIEPAKIQLDYFFQAGYKPGDIKELLGEMEISSVGWLSDIERQGPEELSLLREAEKLFETAARVGSHAVEIINGPVDWHAADCFRRKVPYKGYMGLLGYPREERDRLTVKNLKALADLASQFNLTLFF